MRPPLVPTRRRTALSSVMTPRPVPGVKSSLVGLKPAVRVRSAQSQLPLVAPSTSRSSRISGQAVGQPSAVE